MFMSSVLILFYLHLIYIYIYIKEKKPIMFLNLLFHTQSQKLLGRETRTKHMALPGNVELPA
jgi:hypothetical protein